MQISLRSHLIAGTAAVLGAGAVAAAPAAVSMPSLAIPSTTQVALAAFDSPLSELLGTLGEINNNIFNGSEFYGDYEWEPYQGLLPEFIYTALPIISQLGFNGSTYIGTTIETAINAVGLLGEAVWNLPSAVITAAGQAIGGDIPGAIDTLVDATIAPIGIVGYITLAATIAVVGGVVTNLVNVAITVPGIATGLVNTLVGGVGGLVGAVTNIATQTVGALLSLDFETAWNTVVDGLLGPVGADDQVTSSLPGTLIALTIGPGLGPLGYPNGYAVPSLRMWGEQSQLQIANAIGASYPVPAAAEQPRSAASLRSAAATVAEPESSPATATTATTATAATDTGDDAPSGDAGEPSASGGDTAASTGTTEDKPAKSRAVRNAAKR